MDESSVNGRGAIRTNSPIRPSLSFWWKKSLFWILIVTVEFAGIFANHSPWIRVLSHSWVSAHVQVWMYVSAQIGGAIPKEVRAMPFFCLRFCSSRCKKKKETNCYIPFILFEFWWVEYSDERMMTRPFGAWREWTPSPLLFARRIRGLICCPSCGVLVLDGERELNSSDHQRGKMHHMPRTCDLRKLILPPFSSYGLPGRVPWFIGTKIHLHNIA